jgi:DNA-directed RNA polymerase subunit beta
LPESFNVLLKELQSLGLDVELLETAPPERRSAHSDGQFANTNGRPEGKAKTGTEG